jgi:hypothetical protein
VGATDVLRWTSVSPIAAVNQSRRDSGVRMLIFDHNDVMPGVAEVIEIVSNFRQGGARSDDARWGYRTRLS